MMQARVDVDRSVGYALKRASAALRGAMDAALRPFGLSVPQYVCLELLSQHPGLSAAELARDAFVTRQSMHTVLQGLQDRGLLVRPAVAAHGRSLSARLTGQGVSLIEEASRAVADVERLMLSGLSTGDRERLHAELVACATALDPDPRA